MPRFGWSVAVFAVTALAWLPAHAAAERSAAPDSACRGALLPSDRLPMYEIRRLHAANVRQLRAYLAHECWALALQTYYSRFRPDLPDWVVYIDSAGTVHQGLVGGHTRPGTPQIFDGERYIWAAVFIDLPMHRADAPFGTEPDTTGVESPKSPTHPGADRGASPGHPAPEHAEPGPPVTGAKLEVGDTTDLSLARRTIAYNRDPMITGVIKGLTRLIGVTPNADPAAPDSVRAIQLQQVSADTGESMWVGYGRFGLVNNAQIELSLSPVRNKAFPEPMPADTPRVDHVFADFVNAKRHVFEVAVLSGVTYGATIPTYNATTLQVSGQSARVGANAYLAAVWNLPIYTPFHESDPFWEQSPLGVFAGTNVLRGNIGDELVAGGTLGHLFGDAGLSIGCSWTQGQGVSNGVVVNRYRARLLIASDLRF